MISSRPKDSELSLHTTWGIIRVSAHRGRVAECRLPRRAKASRRPLKWIHARYAIRDSGDRACLVSAARYLRAAFSGKREKCPPLARLRGTPLAEAVWGALRRIPAGSTMSYGDLARRIGKPGAARAVGRACGRNALPIFIPCHRVVASDGSLGGFSSGLPWKHRLLSVEREQ